MLFRSDVPLGSGSYTVEIDYLQDPKSCTTACTFYKRKILIRSTGSISGIQKSLEEYVWDDLVKNLTQGIIYGSLQPAIDGAASGDSIGITGCNLNEDVSITAGNLNITGCWNPDFTSRDCAVYQTTIYGSLSVSSTAGDITIGGITIR